MEHFNRVLKEKLKGTNVARLCRETGVPRSLLLSWREGALPSLKNMRHIKVLSDYWSLSLEELLISYDASILISSIVFTDQSNKYLIRIEKIK